MFSETWAEKLGVSGTSVSYIYCFPNEVFCSINWTNKFW